MSSKSATRKVQQIVDELKQAAQQLGLQIRVDTGNFRGGRCTVGEQEFVVLNKRHVPEAQLAVLAESLRDLPMDTVYLRPVTRQALEESWASETTAETDDDDGGA